MLKPCVVFGDVLPSWLPVLEYLGYKAVAVILKHATMLSLVESLVGDECVIYAAANWTQLINSPKALGKRVLTGFVDGQVDTKVLGIAETLHVKELISTCLVRRKFGNWVTSTLQVDHEAVGGITGYHSRFSRWSQSAEALPSPDALEYVVPRDASTVLSATEFPRGRRKAPSHSRVLPLQENLGSDGAPIYHGGGLLPGLIDRRTKVLTPCLGLSTDVWGVRTLKFSEVLLAKDYPVTMIELCQSHDFSPALLSGLVPGKCLVHAFRALFDGGYIFLRQRRRRLGGKRK
jgi:hypothetical protein